MYYGIIGSLEEGHLQAAVLFNELRLLHIEQHGQAMRGQKATCSRANVNCSVGKDMQFSTGAS